MNHRILIKGNFSEGNFGDDALLLACHQLLKDLGVSEISVYEGDSLYYQRDLAKDANVGSIDAKKADLVLYAGGTQFFSFSFNKIDFFQNFKSRFAALRWATRQHSAYAMIGVGLGPFNNGINQNIFAKTIIKKSSFIWVRDEHSYAECKNLKIGNYHLGADLCFLSSFQNWCDLKSNEAKSVKKIGIVLRDWKYGDGNSYIDKLITLNHKLNGANYETVFYLFSDKKDGVVEDILNRNNLDYLKWDIQNYNFKSYLKVLNACDMFVTARYHAAIFSTLMEKPFITVGLDQKLIYLSSQLKSEAFNWFPHENVDDLFVKINHINETYTVVINDVIRVKSEMQNLSDKALKLFQDYVKTVVG